MIIKKTFFTLAVIALALPALAATPEGPTGLAAVRHTYDRSGEVLTFVFRNTDGSAVSPIPRPDVTYSERKNFIRLAFEGVVTELNEIPAEGTAVSSVEVRALHGRTVAYVFLKKPVRYLFRESPRAGALVLGLYDVNAGGYWVRINAPHWRSPDAVYPFWDALKSAAIMTCLLQDESGAYFLSTTADYDTPERAAQVRKTAQAVIDAFLERDLMQPSRPAASVGTVMDSAAGSVLPEPAGNIAEKIDVLVGRLSEDHADIHAGMRHRRASDTMRELAKIGRPAVPALALAATSKDGALRRAALLTLATIGGGEVEQFLIRGLEDSEPSIRQEMVLVLEQPPMTRAKLVALKYALEDEDKWVRFFAARSLTRAWMTYAVPVMMNLLADGEVRDEAADIIRRFISADVSSEIFADLSAAATEKAVGTLLKNWEMDRDFIVPFPSLDESADILERVFKQIYAEHRVRCYVDEKEGHVRMAMREKGGKKETNESVSLVRHINVNLDRDDDLEQIVVMGEGDSVLSDLAVLDDAHHRGEVLWILPLDSDSGSGDARVCLVDVDGDGASEIIMMRMTDIGGIKNVKATIYRAGKGGFEEIFSGEFYGEEKPKGHFDLRKEVRTFIRFQASEDRPRNMVLDVMTKTGRGGNADTACTSATYHWKDGGYKMSDTVVHAPSDGIPDGTEAPLQSRLRVEIIADKSDGKLYIYIDGDLRQTYKAKFGSVEGDKEIEGDRKTPEGEFYVCVKNPHSRYHLSLGLSYPNREDAGRGLRDGIITRDQHDKIVRAIERRTIPPWKTPLGGEIFIHGYSGDGRTSGCVALSNKDMEELFKIANVGTRVVIRP